MRGRRSRPAAEQELGLRSQDRSNTAPRGAAGPSDTCDCPARRDRPAALTGQLHCQADCLSKMDARGAGGRTGNARLPPEVNRVLYVRCART
jgi:hypothetical protein